MNSLFLPARRLAALVLFFVLPGCSDTAQRVVLSGDTMGTHYRVTIVADRQGRAAGHDAAAIDQRLQQRLASLSAIFSTYIADSELSRYNQLPAPACAPVSQELAALLRLAVQVHERSGGAFNPALGPVIARWGFDSIARGDDWQPPGNSELVSLLERAQFDTLVLRADRQLCKQRDMALNFSAIAKGYAVDAVAAELEKLGIRHYLVDIGGELRASGHNPDGQPWRLAVEQPVMASGQVLEVLELSAGGVATSGDYRNFVDHDGQRYGHTIDPRSGQPVSHGLRSVTVVASTAAEADAWATALMVLGPEQGAELAETLGLAVLLVADDTRTDSPDGYQRWYSPAFAEFRQP